MSSTRLITAEFTWHRPSTLSEALDLLRTLDGAMALAGGTDLLIQIKTGEYRPAAIVHLMGIEELGRLEWNGGLAIGAGVRLHRVAEEAGLRERYTALHQAVLGLGSVQVRNMATLAGNLCNASPSADTAGPLIVLGAEVEIAAGGGRPGTSRQVPGDVNRRRVALEDFFTGPGCTVLQRGELVETVILPELPADSGSAFCKIGRVKLDMAKLSASVFVRREGREIAGVRVAVGGAAPRPVRACGVEEALRGRPFSPGALREAAERVEESISPISDIRSTVEYRRGVAPRVVQDAFLEAWKRSGGETEGEETEA